MHKSALLLVGATLFALGGCGGRDKQENSGEHAASDAAAQASALPPVSAAPDAKPGITVGEGVLVLPVVKGNPGVAYFAVSNGGTAAGTLAAVVVDGAAKAEMHETKGASMAAVGTVEIKPGETVRFERGGKHVMLFGLADTVKPGGTAEMTLTFAGGDKVSIPLRVETMAATMEGMGHGDPN